MADSALSGSGTSEFHALARRFDQLITSVDGADIRVPEDSALISLANDLVPAITRLLRQGVALLTDVEAAYGAPADGRDQDPLTESESLTDIGLQISAELAARDLDNVAFFARTDLNSCLEHLVSSAIHKSDLMALASNCESSVRRLRKALVSVESAIYEYEGEPPPKRKWFDVDVSLQIRKLYWNLRRETGGYNTDASLPLEVRLRSVLYRIVAFRELSVYPLLRVDDRVSLRRLLARILDWLNGDTHDPAAGRRLWQDLATFADILVHVSHRQELRDHDRDLVATALHTLFPHGRPAPVLPQHLGDRLHALLGLDLDLDELILRGSAAPVESWREPLERLHKSLNRSETAAVGKLDLWAE